MAKKAGVILILAWVLLVAVRIIGPSDICEKEQPRTTSYTADMLLHHHWILQYDTFGIPSTKPPLFNYISVPFVMAFGFREWTLRVPSILSSLAVIGCMLLFGRWIQARAGQLLTPVDRAYSGMELTLLAVVLWLANEMTARLIYLARPDMLLNAFLCGAWFAATMLVQSKTPRRGAAMAYWLCTTGSALTKGPMALLPLFYLPLAVLLIRGDWTALKGARLPLKLRRMVQESFRQIIWMLKSTGWWWGVPLLIGTCAAWGLVAYQQEPEFFRQVFLGREIADRAAGPRQLLTTFLHGPAYMITRFLPWSLCVPVMFWLIPVRRWFKHPLAPAILWILLILFVYSFARTKRPDRYAPVFPAMALVAAYFLLYAARMLRGASARRAEAGLIILVGAIILGLSAYYLHFSEVAKLHYGTNLDNFVQAVRQRAGTDPILFLDGQQMPLETLLGRHQGGTATLAQQRAAQWCIRFHDPGSVAEFVSEPIPQIDGEGPGRLGLYHLKPGEGIAEFQKALLVPTSDADDPSGDLPSGLTGQHEKWVQVWRYHTHLPPLTHPAKPE